MAFIQGRFWRESESLSLNTAIGGAESVLHISLYNMAALSDCMNPKSTFHAAQSDWIIWPA
jgi:hypothetical protein